MFYQITRIISFALLVITPAIQLTAQASSTPSLYQVQSGDGLSAIYFDTKDLRGGHITRIDSQVNFAWGSGGSPHPSIPNGNFSSRWAGKIRTLEAGSYLFQTETTSGVRLWIDGVLIINGWSNSSTTVVRNGSITLEANRRYTLVMEHFHQSGSPRAILRWRTPSQSHASVIPRAQLYSETRVFPAAAEVVDVTQPPYNAVGDGVTDDWWAIQRAISNHLGNSSTARNLIYLPNGTYRISKPLFWRRFNADGITVNILVRTLNEDGSVASSQTIAIRPEDIAAYVAALPSNQVVERQGWDAFLTLQGQNRGNTIIRLDDGVFPTANSANESTNQQNFNPQAVIYTAGPSWVEEGVDRATRVARAVNGQSNEAFRNCIFDLTVELGANNAGASGISYQVSNQGAIRNVTIRSLDGQGHAAIRSTRGINGPGFIKDILTQGFSYGYQGGQLYSNFTFENIMIRNPSISGILTREQVLAFRNLRIDRAPVAVQINDNKTHLVVVSGKFTGDNANRAVDNTVGGALLLRDIAVSGYTHSILNGMGSSATTVQGNVTEFTSAAPYRAFPDSLTATLNLPMVDAPDYSQANLTQWAVVGPPNGVNDTSAIQAALDSGLPVVCFSNWRDYYISDTLVVPPHVQQIIGPEAVLRPTGSAFSDPENPRPVFRVTGETSQPLLFERFDFRFESRTGAIGFRNESGRALALRHIQRGPGLRYIQSASANAAIFLEDVSASNFRFTAGDQVFAWQLNPEGEAEPKVLNEGADLWILGIKSEGRSTLIETRGSGRTELLGGMVYPARNAMAERTAFRVIDAAATFSYATTAYPPGQTDYGIHLSETRAGVTQTVQATQLPARGGGRNVSLMVARSEDHPPSFLSQPSTLIYGGLSFSYTPQLDSVPAATLTVSGLPAWATLSNGGLTGSVPSEAAPGTLYGPITLTATNSAGSADQTFTLVVGRFNATTLIANPGFETGTGPWGYASASRVSSAPSSGSHAARVDGPVGGLWQDLIGLLPNTTYRLTASAYASTSGQTVYLFAQNFDSLGTSLQSPAITASSYDSYSVIFTTGPAHSTAQIGAWKTSGAGFAMVDDFVLQVISPPWNTHGNQGMPWVLPRLVEAEFFDEGGSGVAYFDATPANLGGAYRTSEQVDIEATDDAGGGFNIGWIDAGEWLDYTIEVPEAGSYDFDFRVASETATGQIALALNGEPLAGPLSLPPTGNAQQFQTVTMPAVLLPAGTHLLRISFLAGGFNLNWWEAKANALSPAGSFDLWRAAHFNAEQLADPLISGPAATPAGDGIPNLAKHAYGVDPWVYPPAQALPSLDTSALPESLTLNFRIAKTASDVVVTPWWSADLGEESWTTTGLTIEQADADDHFRYFRVTAPAAAQERMFLRLSFAIPAGP